MERVEQRGQAGALQGWRRSQGSLGRTAQLLSHLHVRRYHAGNAHTGNESDWARESQRVVSTYVTLRSVAIGVCLCLGYQTTSPLARGRRERG